MGKAAALAGLFGLWAGPYAVAGAVPLATLQLAASGAHTCALLADHSVKCWGANDAGQLGQGDEKGRGDQPQSMGTNLAPVALGTGRTAAAVATGSLHSCAVLDDHSVKCWGSGSAGQLGQGDKSNRGDQSGSMGDALKAVDLGPGSSATALALGTLHTCALLTSGAVKCWGSNDTGQLGLGDTLSRGGASGQMGAALPAVDLGKNRTALAIAASENSTCALLDNGALKCWGANYSGQLGLGDTAARGLAPGQMGDALPAVDVGGRKTLQVTLGNNTVCVRLDDASVRCWGRDDTGQLGDGGGVNASSRGEQPGDMGANLPAVLLAPNLPARAVACGTEATCCALFLNNALKCWGSNSDGELGLEDTQGRGAVPGQMGDILPFVDLGPLAAATAVTVGDSYACALLAGGQVKCWGANDAGQLGAEDQTSRGGNPGDMGAKLPTVSL